MLMPEKPIFITKVSAEKVLFSAAKSRQIIKRASGGSAIIDLIVGQVELMFYDGMSTKFVFSQAFSLLRKHSKPWGRKAGQPNV